MARTLWRLSTAVLLLLGGLLTTAQPLSAQEKDKGSLLEDILDILRKSSRYSDSALESGQQCPTHARPPSGPTHSRCAFSCEKTGSSPAMARPRIRGKPVANRVAADAGTGERKGG